MQIIFAIPLGELILKYLKKEERFKFFLTTVILKVCSVRPLQPYHFKADLICYKIDGPFNANYSNYMFIQHKIIKRKNGK
jgi:hypothetical protein